LGFSTVLRCLRTVGREIPMSRAIAVIVCFAPNVVGGFHK
jgi:hypothetical protein